MRKYRFYKNELGWFIGLKWFPFNKAYLAMVMGADILLDILSVNGSEVNLQVSTSPIPFYDGILKRKQVLGTMLGAYYTTDDGYEGKYGVTTVKSVWLCPVTLWVFLRYPKQIYFKVI